MPLGEAIEGLSPWGALRSAKPERHSSPGQVTVPLRQGSAWIFENRKFTRMNTNSEIQSACERGPSPPLVTSTEGVLKQLDRKRDFLFAQSNRRGEGEDVALWGFGHDQDAFFQEGLDELDADVPGGRAVGMSKLDRLHQAMSANFVDQWFAP